MEVADLEDEAFIARFDAFARGLLRGIPARYHQDLAREYSLGLMGPGERKTVEPIVRRMRGRESPARERDTREMLASDWSHRSLTWTALEQVLELTDGWRAWTVDDTACLKQGAHSVGVANQYAGCVGRLANCQVLVTIGIAQEHVSTPCAAELFLPESWDNDIKRRNECHVPRSVRHTPKWQMALRMLDQIEYRDLPKLPVLADAGYGDASEFRRGLDKRGLFYVVGVSSTLTVVRAGLTFSPAPSPPKGSAGRPATRLMIDQPFEVMAVEACARSLPEDQWRDVVWRIGSKGEQRGRFAAVRIRPARGIDRGRIHPEDLQPEQWLLMHWPEGEPAPTKAWLSSLPAATQIHELIAYARMRWRIERDFREGKGLVGLDHYEGRTWCGLHHHAAFVLLAQMFLATERWRGLDEISRAIPERVQAAIAATPPSALRRPKAGARRATPQRAEHVRDRT